MVPNYRTITISADANVNIVPLIYKKLQEEGPIYITSNFKLDFIGFEADSGTEVKINGNTVKVPSTGKFYTPYLSSSDFISIHSVEFDEAISGMDFWIIY